MPTYLTEADVDRLLTPADAIDAVEDSFRRLAAGTIENVPRYRVRLDGGALAVMSAVDRERGLACVKTYAATGDGASLRGRAVRGRGAEGGDRGRQCSAGCAPARRARSRRSTSPGRAARSLGVIGCGTQARTQVACIREALPWIDSVVAYCRNDGAAGGVLPRSRGRAG